MTFERLAARAQCLARSRCVPILAAESRGAMPEHFSLNECSLPFHDFFISYMDDRKATKPKFKPTHEVIGKRSKKVVSKFGKNLARILAAKVAKGLCKLALCRVRGKFPLTSFVLNRSIGTVKAWHLYWVGL